MSNSSTFYTSAPQEEGQQINEKITIAQQPSAERISAKDIFKAVILLSIFFIAFLVFKQNKPTISQTTLNTWKQNIQQAINRLQSPQAYIQIEEVAPFAQLPFCIVVIGQTAQKESQIKKSVSAQTYNNYEIIVSLLSPSNYAQLKNSVDNKCSSTSILIIADKPLKQGSLSMLNEQYQRFNTWMTYDDIQGSDEVQIGSLYKRVFDMVQTNTFGFSNKALLESANSNALVAAILQLCQFHNKKTQISKIFEQQINIPHSFFRTTLNKDSSQISIRTPYQPLYNLNQDYELNDWQQNVLLEKYQQLQNQKNDPKQLHPKNQKIKAFQYMSLLYLPNTHSLNFRQTKQMEQRYQLSKSQVETPFCVTILSRNNIQNNRYKKVMQTIMQQEYHNFHIVFIDDASNDDTLLQTQIYLNEKGFPRDKITYVKNKQNNFATYNIINAAFQYCHADEVQVLVDGDDELIGKKAFKVMSKAYENDPNTWIAFSGYVNMLFKSGRSYPFENKYDLLTVHEKRRFGHFISPIRTWKVGVVRAIPKEHHEDFGGVWLRTLYDDGIMYPLNELAGMERIKYVNEFNYFYNNLYSGGDGDTAWKKFCRFWFKIQILLRKPIEKLPSLQQDHTQYDILQILKLDYGTKYQLIE